MRTSDKVLAMVDDALERLTTPDEIVASTDFSFAALPAVTGVIVVGIMHIAIKGVELGTVIENFNIIGDTALLAPQEFIDNCVRTGLESIRTQKAQALALPNGHSG